MPDDYSRKRQRASASSCPSSWQVPKTSLGKVRLWAGCLGNLLSRLVGRLAKEAHQCGVYFFRVRPRDAVWTVLHDH